MRKQGNKKAGNEGKRQNERKVNRKMEWKGRNTRKKKTEVGGEQNIENEMRREEEKSKIKKSK